MDGCAELAVEDGQPPLTGAPAVRVEFADTGRRTIRLISPPLASSTEPTDGCCRAVLRS
ncbi:hypothetical protein I546_1430 [Mycobacterium kansasii 732]|nr:hypothetical protein I546_1430 [Mycobacterium kansasii 732]